MQFKNIDTSHLTPEQLAEAELMAEYAQSNDCKRSFNIVRDAEHILPSLLVAADPGHRLSPVDAFALALKYAQHAHNAGEVFMQEQFEAWKSARPTDPAPPPDDVTDLEDADVQEFNGNPGVIDPAETITRETAVADTEARVEAGELVSAGPKPENVPGIPEEVLV